MARDIETIGRQVGSAALQIDRPRVSGGEQLISALQGFGNIIGGMAEAAAVEKAQIQGAADRDAGKTPNLAPAFTRPTAAYNQAVRETDARIVGRVGLDLLAEQASKATDPRYLNSDSVRGFTAQAQGTIDGVVQSALPENRAAVRDYLERAASSSANRVRGAVIQYDNEVLRSKYSLEIDQAKNAVLDAAMSTGPNKAELLRDAREEVENIKARYALQSNEIAKTFPEFDYKLDRAIRQAEYVGEFTAQLEQSQDKGDDYLNAFFFSKPDNLTQEEKLETLSQMLKINNQVKGAQAGAQALIMQKLENDIDNPESPNYISNQDQLESQPDWALLTPYQQGQMSHKLIQKNSGEFKKQQRMAKVEANVANGLAYLNTGEQKDEVFLDKMKDVAIEQGKLPDIYTQFREVIRLNSNVPAFDKLMNSVLTTNDVDAVRNAGLLYANAKIAGKDNLIKLNNDANTMAEKMSTVFEYNTNPDDKIVQGIIDQVLNKSAPKTAERLSTAADAWKKNGPSFFKSAMGESPDVFNTSGAYEAFRLAFTNAMVSSASESEAARVAKRAMSNWGSDPWFKKGQVARFPASKVITGGNVLIHNQMVNRFNEIKDNFNNEPEYINQPRMKFAREMNIPESMSEYDLVYKVIGQPEGDTLKDALDMVEGVYDSDVGGIVPQIFVTVNGVTSELKLDSADYTGASPSKGYVYGLYAKDENGVYQQIKDPKSPDGLAYIVLKDVDQIAPSMMREGYNKQLIENMERSMASQREREIYNTYADSALGGALNRIFPGISQFEAKAFAKMYRMYEDAGKGPMDAEKLKEIVESERTKRLNKGFDKTIFGDKEDKNEK